MSLETARSHHPRIALAEEARALVHGGHALGRLNAKLAVAITTAVGSMWCAYAFMALALVSLPSAIQSGNLVIIVAWISQTFLQLVLLSVIIVGQKVQEAATDLRAVRDHETLIAIHTLSVAIHEIDARQSEILERLDPATAKPSA